MNVLQNLRTTVIIGAALWMTSQPLGAHASASSPFTSTLTLTNDYLWRGQSFSNRLPAIQGSLDYAHESGVAASVWMSNAVTAAGNDTEADLSLSYTASVGAVTLGASAFWYTYNEDATSNAVEGLVSAAMGPVKLEVSYLPKYFVFDTSSTYLKLGVKQPVADKVAFIGHLGWTAFADEAKTLGPDGTRSFKNYFDYRAGLSYTNEGFTYEGAFIDTDRKYADGTKIYDRTLSLTVSKTF